MPESRQQKPLPIDHYEVVMSTPFMADYLIGKIYTQDAMLALVAALTRQDVDGIGEVKVRICPCTDPVGT